MKQKSTGCKIIERRSASNDNAEHDAEVPTVTLRNLPCGEIEKVISELEGWLEQEIPGTTSGSTCSGDFLFHVQDDSRTKRKTIQFGYNFFKLEAGDTSFVEPPSFIQRIGEQVLRAFDNISSSGKSHDSLPDDKAAPFNNIIVSIYLNGFHLEPHVDTDVPVQANRGGHQISDKMASIQEYSTDAPAAEITGQMYGFAEEIFGIILTADTTGKLYFTHQLDDQLVPLRRTPCSAGRVGAYKTKGEGYSNNTADEAAQQHAQQVSGEPQPVSENSLVELVPDLATEHLYELPEQPGLAFRLRGAVRRKPYYHGVSEVQTRRVSITFRHVILF